MSMKNVLKQSCNQISVSGVQLFIESTFLCVFCCTDGLVFLMVILWHTKNKSWFKDFFCRLAFIHSVKCFLLFYIL